MGDHGERKQNLNFPNRTKNGSVYNKGGQNNKYVHI